MKRREFIILSGVGATSASLLSACGHPEEKLIPAFIPDEEYVPGIDYWKASTCGMCPAGCGIIVRTREHKANKIEGNPLHPVNRGALCARGQAGLEVLYNPDRIKGPLKRAGDRGEGKWEEISWDEAIKSLAHKLREIKARGGADGIIFATTNGRGILSAAVDLFRSAYQARFRATEETIDEESPIFNWPEYNRTGPPAYDLANATYLLSFGARFLETWHSPVMYSQAYGEFRGKSGKLRGKFVQIEPRMSLTGANADEWLPAKMSSEGIVALAIAQVILRENLRPSVTAPTFLKEPLDEYAPERTERLTELPAERVIRIAREFAASERPVAFGAGAGATVVDKQANAQAINFLNVLADNFGKPGGVFVHPVPAFVPLARTKHEALGIAEGGFEPSLTWIPSFDHFNGLLLHHANPVQFAPRTRDGIKAIPFIASFSCFMDETTELADVILPDHSYLERWDLKTTSLIEPRVAVSIVQPAIRPQFNTRQTEDVLIALAREFGHSVAVSAPFESAESLVKYAAQDLVTSARPDDESARDQALNDFIERGVFVLEPSKGEAGNGALKGESSISFLQGGESFSEDYPLILLTYEHAVLGFGEQANLPSLQELPDPMTSAIWGTWVEINPKTAASLGLGDGDLVEVITEHGSVRVPVVLYPAIRPDVIAIPYGQGHTSYGRYASNHGVNAAVLNPYAIARRGREETVRARVSKVGDKAALVRFGTALQQQMENKR